MVEFLTDLWRWADINPVMAIVLLDLMICIYVKYSVKPWKTKKGFHGEWE